MVSRKWKLFGNETQEKDFVVTGGLLWWRDHVVMGCYSILENRDEIRIYPRDTRLDNTFVKVVRVSAQVLLLNTLCDRLITFCANGQISIYSLSVKENHSCKLFYYWWIFMCCNYFPCFLTKIWCAGLCISPMLTRMELFSDRIFIIFSIKISRNNYCFNL